MRFFRPGLLVLSGLLSALADMAVGAPGYGLPITATTGTVYTVSSVSELQNTVSAVNSGGIPATILINDGTYVLSSLLHMTCNGVIVRSANGDRDRVILRGPDEGKTATLTHVFLVPASYVTIADVTLGWCLYHGIQVQGESPNDAAGLWVHNVRLVNCNEQFIKGSSADADPVGATEGIIENCLFEFTGGWSYQYYTGGIDIHKGVSWIVRENLFRNIRVPAGESGMAEHAIHFWKRCTTQPQNIVVERNWIVNCDRGIGLGLGDYASGFNGGTSAIRNNFVYNNGAGASTDVGIGLESANNVRVDNNTVYVSTYWAPMEYRFAASSNLVYRNNLTDKAIQLRDGAPVAVTSNNLQSLNASWFVNASQGDLHVKYGVTNVIDRGLTLGEFSDDLDGQSRPKLGAWDVGADEYDMDSSDSDGDGMTDGWEVAGGLSPTNATGIHGPDGNPDGDGMLNREEFAADTDPNDSASELAMASLAAEGANIRVMWRGGMNATQMLQRCWTLLSGTGQWVSVFTAAPPTATASNYLDAAAGTTGFYRIRARRP